METKMYRQGDILLKEIDKLPTKLSLCKNSIIVQGLSTGHAHKFKESKVKLYESKDNVKYVSNPLKVAHLVHDEHDTLDISNGVYKIIIQKEFDLIEGIRQVQD